MSGEIIGTYPFRNVSSTESSTRSVASGIFGVLNETSPSTPDFIEYARDMLFFLIVAIKLAAPETVYVMPHTQPFCFVENHKALPSFA